MLVLSCSISYSDLIKCLYFADTAERGGRAWKEAQRQGEDRVTLQIARIENWCWVLVFPRVSWLLLHEASFAPLLHYPTTALGRRTTLRSLLSSTTHHSACRRTTLRSLLSSATTTPQQETSLLPRHSFGISLSLRLLTFVACSNSLDSSPPFFPHLSLHSCVYIYAFISIASTNTIVFQFQIPVFEFCLSFLSVLLRFWRSDFVNWFRAFELLDILVFLFF
jgi:hypothetical protein